MAIDVRELRAQPLDPEIEEELDSFEDGVRRFLAGEIDEDVFRVFRLNHGVYGQRQGGHNQMLRVKIPYGKVEPDQLEMLRLHRRDLLARLGPPHHPPERAVPLRAARDSRPRSCALLASVGLTSREACGDTVRNVMGCHLAGACPYEVLDISAVGRGRQATSSCATRIAQRLPRKFKINFSGCATDCGQAMFNDVGVIAVHAPARRRHRRGRLPGVHRRRPRRQPAPGAGARGVHRPRRPARPPSRRSCARSTTTATATTSSGPA